MINSVVFLMFDNEEINYIIITGEPGIDVTCG